MKKQVCMKIKIIFSYYAQFLRYNIFLSIFSILSFVVLYVTPLLNAFIIDEAIGNKKVFLLFISVVAYFFLNFISDIFSYFESMLNLKCRYKIEQNLKNDLLNYFLECRREKITDFTSGEIIAILRNDASKFIALLTKNIHDVIIAVIKIVFTMILIFKLQMYLGLLVVVLQFIIILFKRQFNCKLAKNSIEIREKYISVTEKLNEIAFHMTEIPMLNASNYVLKRYNKSFDESYLIDRKNTKIFQWTRLVSNVLDTLMICLILLLGGYYVSCKSFSIGLLLSFISYSTMLSQPIYELCELPTQYSNDKDSIDCIFDILIKFKNKKYFKKKEKPIQIKIDNIVLDSICFQYNTDNIIFENASAIFDKKKINYIIGKSGIGKSTLVKLLLGYYSIQNGMIRIGEENIASIIERGELQQYISWVPQEPVIFQDTVRNNIVFDQNVSEDSLEIVCERCAILDEIHELKDGFDTMLEEEGNNLSVGQKQRIGLARALLNERPIIIIDEPTASVDVETEKIIKRNLKDIMQDRIVIIITHSYDFILKNSNVFEIKNKKIERRGTECFV